MASPLEVHGARAGRTLLLIATALGAGCARPAAPAAAAPVAAGPVTARPVAPVPAAAAPVAARPVVVDSNRGFLSLADGSVHLAAEGTPSGLYVGGSVEGGRFVPDGDVQGEGKVGESCPDAGWLELLEGRFLLRASGREPVRPFLAGALETDGSFCPRSRGVAY